MTPRSSGPGDDLLLSRAQQTSGSQQTQHCNEKLRWDDLRRVPFSPAIRVVAQLLAAWVIFGKQTWVTSRKRRSIFTIQSMSSLKLTSCRGQPIGVLASARSEITASNFYSTHRSQRGQWVGYRSDPPSLPLFGIVELGKHATAPDVNRDGILTIGRDVNTYTETAHVWGIRDHIGDTDSHFGGFKSAQMAPRQHRNRFASSAYTRFFRTERNSPELHVPEQNQICKLIELPAKPGLDSSALEREAENKLMNHRDAQTPQRTYKSWYAPYVHLRGGVGRTLGTGGYEFSLAGAVQLQRLTLLRGIGRALPNIPGRIAGEMLITTAHSRSAERVLEVRPSGREVQVFGRENLSVAKLLGLRYERHLSNHFGFHVGAHYQVRKWRFENEMPVAGVYTDNGWLWRIEPMWDYPFSKHVGWIFHAGAVVRNGPVQDWGIEARVSYTLFSRRGRDEFGIRGR